MQFLHSLHHILHSNHAVPFMYTKTSKLSALWMVVVLVALAPLTAFIATAEETTTTDPAVTELQEQIAELRVELKELRDRVTELESDQSVSSPERPYVREAVADKVKERVRTMMQERKVNVCHNGNTLSVSVNSALAYKRAGEAEIGSCERWNKRKSWDDDDDDSVENDDDWSDDDDDDDDDDDSSSDDSNV